MPSAHASGGREEFRALNILFFNRLDEISSEVKDLSSGHMRHPKLRTSILKDFASDITCKGLEETKVKWRYWLCPALVDIAPYKLPEKAEVACANKRGRPRLFIPAKRICDTLRATRNVKAAAKELSCSRAYIYAVLGREKVREVIQ